MGNLASHSSQASNHTMTETETTETPGWIQRLKNIWTEYLQIGDVLGILGAIGFWIWFMDLWGLWGFFLGWIPAGLLGLLVLRFIWLPVVVTGLFFLFQAFSTTTQVIIFKIFIFGCTGLYVVESAERNLRKKKKNNDKN